MGANYELMAMVLHILVSLTFQQRRSAPPLIPRDVWFGNKIGMVKMSPDARYLAFMKPYENVVNLWVAEVNSLRNEDDIERNAKVVTNNTQRGIREYDWTYLPGILIYYEDYTGSENFNMFKLNVSQSNPSPENILVDPKEIGKLAAKSADNPQILMLTSNKRKPTTFDFLSYDLISGEQRPYYTNDQFGNAFFDNDLNMKLASLTLPSGDVVFIYPIKASEGRVNWTELRTVALADAGTFGTLTTPQGFDKTNKHVYFWDAQGSDLGQLTSCEVGAGICTEKAILYSAKKGEMPPKELSPLPIGFHPTEHNPLYVTEWYDKMEIIPINDTIRQDMDYLKQLDTEGEMVVESFSTDFNKWLISYGYDNRPRMYYIYDRINKRAERIVNSQPELGRYQMSKKQPVEIRTRDGLTQLCYLTLPFEESPRPSRPLPMVLNVHGGPTARNAWIMRMRDVSQLFANRGYAVLQCNYRGSTGFGKDFTNAGNGEWAGKMHDDLIDAVNWAIGSGIAQKDKIAISGASYGGYATLVGLTFTPEVFACGIDVFGISNMTTTQLSNPPQWTQYFEGTVRMMGGDARTEEGRRILDSKSPITKVNNIVKPLLIIQGANDIRVVKAESDQIVNAMRKRNIPVSYVVFPDEGHGFAKLENNKLTLAMQEKFLSKCLGGRFEPLGDDLEKTSAQILQDDFDLAGKQPTL